MRVEVLCGVRTIPVPDGRRQPMREAKSEWRRIWRKTTVYRSYYDIISRITETPLWWQEGGIPRYDKFDLTYSTGLHTSEVALAEIACQMTGIRFVVAFEGNRSRRIAASIRDFSLWYGDPPNVGEVAESTSSITLRVLEYWLRYDEKYVVDGKVIDHKLYDEWARDPSLEVDFPDFDQNEIPIYWNPWMSDGKIFAPRPPRLVVSITRQWNKFWTRFFQFGRIR